MKMRLLCVVAVICFVVVQAFRISPPKGFSSKDGTNLFMASNVVSAPTPTSESEVVSPKLVTKEIMAVFGQLNNKAMQVNELKTFGKKLQSEGFVGYVDGMHVLTLLFQTARIKRKINNAIPVAFLLTKLKSWNKEWSERDISAFVYGIQALDCLDPVDGEFIKFGAEKIAQSTAKLTSRAIGNSLYGLHMITSDRSGVPELCAALADKIVASSGDLNGQDIGIGMYGLQGMSASVLSVRSLIKALAAKIASSETELDAQAMSNALYGFQVTYRYSFYIGLSLIFVFWI
jgi:hypothetical protein